MSKRCQITRKDVPEHKLSLSLGTDDLNDVYTDVATSKVQCTIQGIDCGLAHGGFYGAYMTIVDFIAGFRAILTTAKPNHLGLPPRFFVTGHSLGGCAFALQVFNDFISGFSLSFFHKVGRLVR